MILPYAAKLVRASDSDLTPSNACKWGEGIDPAHLGYMLAHERHRRGLSVKLVEAK